MFASHERQKLEKDENSRKVHFDKMNLYQVKNEEKYQVFAN
jgi:hypothetical protein